MSVSVSRNPLALVFGNSHLIDEVMRHLTPEDQRNVVAFVAEAGCGEVAKELVLFHPKLYAVECTLCPIIRVGKKMGAPRESGVCKWCTRVFANHYWRYYNLENYDGPLKLRSERISMLEYFENLTQDDLDDIATLVRLKVFIPEHIRRLKHPHYVTQLEFNLRPVREIVYFLRNLYVGELMPLTNQQRRQIEHDVYHPDQKKYYERVDADEVVGVDLVDLTDAQFKAIKHCFFHPPNWGHGDRFQRFDILYHTDVGQSISLRILNSLHWMNYDRLKEMLSEESHKVFDVYSALAILRNHYVRYDLQRCVALLKRISGESGVWTRSVEELDVVVSAL